MGRKKIPNDIIVRDERRRQITLSKRKRGLFKKAKELAVLTGVDVAVIVTNGDKSYEFASSNINEIFRNHTVFTANNSHAQPSPEQSIASFPLLPPLHPLETDVSTIDQFWTPNLE